MLFRSRVRKRFLISLTNGQFSQICIIDVKRFIFHHLKMKLKSAYFIESMSARKRTLPIKIITTVLHSEGSFFFSTVLGFFTMTRVSKSSRGDIDKLNIYYRTSSFLADRLLFLLFSEGPEISSSFTSEPIEIMSDTSSSESGLCCC